MSHRFYDEDICMSHAHDDWPLCGYCRERHTRGAECAGWLLVEHEGLEENTRHRARQIERALHVNEAVADREDPTDWFYLADEADGRLREIMTAVRARYEAWLAAEYPETSAAAE